MTRLTLHDTYSRKDVHDIFDPATEYTPQGGKWGVSGIVSIPDRSGDFVFFVTYGQAQGSHNFDEGISEDGVLTWQSKPSQKLTDPQIRQLIIHDELSNAIYLFLRTRPGIDYTYMGTLKYLSHDATRSCPVHFQWQLEQGPLPSDVNENIQLKLSPSEKPATTASTKPASVLTMMPSAPASRVREGTGTNTFRTKKRADYGAMDAKHAALGRAGELLVVEYERELGNSVIHVSDIEGDGAGYDIRSEAPDGSVKYIEVKTTTGAQSSQFYMSSNELAFAKQHSSNYYIYRLYSYDKESDSAFFYVEQGDPETNFALTPTEYRVSR